MTIRYLPRELLKKIAPPKKLEKLVTENATLNRAALSFVDDIEFLDKKSISKVALKTIKSYRARIKSDPDLADTVLDDPKLLVSRLQNEVIFQIKDSIRENYEGATYEWLPSDADEPDPEHQLNYGKIFMVGVGEMPGDRYGCRCGMEILVKEKELNLEV